MSRLDLVNIIERCQRVAAEFEASLARADKAKADAEQREAVLISAIVEHAHTGKHDWLEVTAYGGRSYLCSICGAMRNKI